MVATPKTAAKAKTATEPTLKASARIDMAWVVAMPTKRIEKLARITILLRFRIILFSFTVF